VPVRRVPLFAHEVLAHSGCRISLKCCMLRGKTVRRDSDRETLRVRETGRQVRGAAPFTFATKGDMGCSRRATNWSWRSHAATPYRMPRSMAR